MTDQAAAIDAADVDEPVRRPARPLGVIRPTELSCAWCGVAVTVPPRGRIPKWCGTSCRHRAWEQRRAAANGRVAIEVVERIMDRPVTTVIREEVRVPGPPVKPSTPEQWAELLIALADQMDVGRVYPRDWAALEPGWRALDGAVARFRHVYRR